jgi:hypothetical protein
VDLVIAMILGLVGMISYFIFVACGWTAETLKARAYYYETLVIPSITFSVALLMFLCMSFNFRRMDIKI